jgi:hypothetical protein
MKGKMNSNHGNKNKNKIGIKRKSQKSGKSQTVIHESEGANPDSVKTILIEDGNSDTIIDYRIEYPESDTQYCLLSLFSIAIYCLFALLLDFVLRGTSDR